jgi:DNA/RNA endonuclease YhcR with UshA esterase domain
MNDTLLPGQTEQPAETLCPSCGRFVGALTRCTHCGARVAKRMSLRLFRYAALAAGTVGLGLLYLLATQTDIYDEIGEKILLMPGTPIRARVGVKTHRDQLPLSLGRGADLEFPAAASPARMTAGPGAPAGEAQDVGLGDITADLAGRIVKTQGRVAEIRAPQAGSKAPYELVLQEGDKTVTVVYWDTVAIHLEQNKPVIGALMGVRGMVSVYKEKVQLKVNHSDQLALLDVAPVSKPAVQPGTAVAIGTITPAMAGSVVTLRGTLGEPNSIKSGVIFPLTDPSGSIQLVLWDRHVPGADRDRLAAGVKVAVSGKIEEYKGSLEIVPANAQAIEVEPAPAP